MSDTRDLEIAGYALLLITQLEGERDQLREAAEQFLARVHFFARIAYVDLGIDVTDLLEAMAQMTAALEAQPVADYTDEETK